MHFFNVVLVYTTLHLMEVRIKDSPGPGRRGNDASYWGSLHVIAGHQPRQLRPSSACLEVKLNFHNSLDNTSTAFVLRRKSFLVSYQTYFLALQSLPSQNIINLLPRAYDLEPP